MAQHMKNKSVRKYLLVTSAAVLVIALAAGLTVRLIDVDRYRPQVEAAITEATGLACTISRLRLSLRPLLNLHAEKAALTKNGKELLAADQLTVAIHLLPLLRRDIEIREIVIDTLRAVARRNAAGQINILPALPSPTGPAGLPFNRLHLNKISLNNATLRFEDIPTATTLHAEKLSLALGPFALVNHGQPLFKNSDDFLQQADFSGQLTAQTLRINAVSLHKLALRFSYAGHTLRINPLTALLHGSEAGSTLTIANIGTMPQIAFSCTVKHLEVGPLMTALQQKQRLAGRLDLYGELFSFGNDRAALLKNLAGTVAIKGKQLTVSELDLDTILNQYEKSQNIGLFDIGSIFVVGPFGPLLSKVFDLSGTALGIGRGSSRITHLVSDWNIRKGVAAARDVAFATSKNRLALKGKIDLAQKRFDDLEIAILDARGCAKFIQTVNGTFQDPDLKKASLLTRSLINPVFSLLKKGAATLTGTEGSCTPFYQGSVPHPATP